MGCSNSVQLMHNEAQRTDPNLHDGQGRRIVPIDNSTSNMNQLTPQIFQNDKGIIEGQQVKQKNVQGQDVILPEASFQIGNQLLKLSKQKQTNNLNSGGKNNQSLKYLNNIKFKQIIQNLHNKYHKYINSKNTLQKVQNYDLDRLKQQIRTIYVGIIRQKILQANDDKLTILQCKIQISQYALQLQIQCLKHIIIQNGNLAGIEFYQQMQKFLKQLAEFLQTKYPRSQVIDSIQLTKLIKQINATQQYQYDILKNAGICFRSTDVIDITKTIKLFINKIIDQLQKMYPQFKQLIQSSFCSQQNSNNQDNKNKKTQQVLQANLNKSLIKLNSKISRKTSLKQQQSNQNVSKQQFKKFLNSKMKEISPQKSKDQSSIKLSPEKSSIKLSPEKSSIKLSPEKSSIKLSPEKSFIKLSSEKTPTKIQNTSMNKQQIQSNQIMSENFRLSSLKQQPINIHKTILQLFYNKNLKSQNHKRHEHKVGRKISQNAGKYTLLQTGTLQIKSPQIQRVLIKWLQNLSQIIQNPRQMITLKNQYKFYSIQKDQKNPQFKKCKEDRIEQIMKQGKLIQKVQKETQKQKQIQKQIDQSFSKFNMSLINIFNEVQHSQHQVSLQQMEVIKFSSYNTDFISYMVEEKLIHSIKTLVSVGKQFEDSGFYLDLIKFKVNDLMRCQFFGNKKKLIQIYGKFQQLDKKRKIDIIKIKNRFQTMLGDAMIFFKLPDSFIICQCQLVLQNQGKGDNEKKGKITSNINHFFYQLQRSPFGVLGQISVFLKSKAQMVSVYCDKIKLKGRQIKKNCLNQHKEIMENQQEDIKRKIIQQQKQPFVCGKCIKFYPKYSNLNKVFQCMQCSIKICNNCMKRTFSITPELLQKQLNDKIQKFEQQFKKTSFYKDLEHQYKRLLIQLKQKNNPKNKDNKGLLKFFKDKRWTIKDLFKQNFKQNKIKVQIIINLLQKLSSNELKQNQNVIFVLTSCTQKSIKFKAYNYNKNQMNIINIYQPLQKYQKHQFLTVSEYDLFLQIKTSTKKSITELKNKYYQSQQGLPLKFFAKAIYLFDGQDKTSIQQRYNQIIKKGYTQDKIYIVYHQVSHFYLIIDFNYSKGSQKEGWVKQHLSKSELNLFRRHIKLNNQGITTKQLKCFDIKILDWISSIKTLNLNENKINNVSEILKNCINLESLSIQNNQIKTLDFVVQLEYLKFLNASKNKSITIVKKLCNIINIQQLDLSDNTIQIIIINKDDFKFNQNFIQEQLTKSITNLSQINQQSKQDENNQNIYLARQKINQIDRIQNKIQNKNQNINQKNSNDKAQKKQSKTTSVIINNNLNKKKFTKNQIDNFIKQKDSYTFPKLNKLILSRNNIKSIQQFSMTNFPILEEFIINKNQLKKLPMLRMPRLKKLNACSNHLSQIDDFELMSLQQLNLFENKLQNINTLIPTMKKLRKLNLSNNNINKLDEWKNGQYQNLVQLILSKNKLKSIPKLKANKLQLAQFNSNSIVHISQFAKCRFPSLKQLSFHQNHLQKIPKFVDMPQLNNIDLSKNKIYSLQQFASKQYPNILELDLSSNFLVQLPPLFMPNLQKIYLRDNIIQNIQQFSQISYNKLTIFHITYSQKRQKQYEKKKKESKDNKKKTNNKDVTKINLHSPKIDQLNKIPQSFDQVKKQHKIPTIYNYYQMFLQIQPFPRNFNSKQVYIERYKNMGAFLLQEQHYNKEQHSSKEQDSRKSLKFYKQALQLIQQNQKTKYCLEYALTTIDIAGVYKKTYQLSQAVKKYEEGLQIIQKISNLDEKYQLEYLLKKADYHAAIDDYQAELITLQKALSVQQQKGQKNSLQFAQIYKRLGKSFLNLGDYSKSIEYYEFALKIYKKYKNKTSKEAYQTYLEIGKVYYQNGDQKKAIQNFQKGIQQQKKVKGQDSHIENIYLQYLMELYIGQQKFQLAIIHCKQYCQNIKLQNKSQSRLYINSLDKLAQLYIKLRSKQSYQQAQKVYYDILKIQKDILNSVNQSNTNDQGKDKNQQQHTPNQKQYVDNQDNKSQTQSQKSQRPKSGFSDKTQKAQKKQASISLILAVVPQTSLPTLQKQLSYKKKQAYLEMALVYDKIGILYQCVQQSKIFGPRFRIKQASQQYQNILKLYIKSNQILNAIGYESTYENIEVLKKIANIYKNRKQYQKSLKVYQQYLEIIKKFHGDQSYTYINTLQQLSQLCMNAKQFAKGLEYTNKCYTIQSKFYGEEYRNVIYLNFKKGLFQLKLKKYSESLKTFENCKNTYKKTRMLQSDQMTNVYQKMGEAYFYNKQKKKSQESFKQSLELQKKLNGQSNKLIAFLCNYSQFYIEQKQYDEAIKQMDIAQIIIQNKNEYNYYFEHSLVYYNFGILNLLKDQKYRKKSALQYFLKAKDIYDNFKNVPIGLIDFRQSNSKYLFMVNQQYFYPKLLENISDIYYKEGKQAQSQKLLKQAIQIVENLQINQERKTLLERLDKKKGQYSLEKTTTEFIKTTQDQINKKNKKKSTQNSVN